MLSNVPLDGWSMRSSIFTSMTNFKMDHNTQDRQMNKVATCNIAVAIAVSWASVGGVCNMFTDRGNAPGRPQIAFQSARATV